jgi:hypothetical protein
VTVPSEANIRHIVELANPRPDCRQQCRDYAIAAIEAIKNCTYAMPSGGLRQKLLNLSSAMKMARIAIEQLPSAAYGALGFEAQMNELARRISIEVPGSTTPRYSPKIDALLSSLREIEQESLAQAQNMDVNPSGGRGRATDRARMGIAVQLACDLIVDWSDEMPTLTRGGRYVRLAGLLFKVATGKKMDAERTCAAYLKHLEKGGEFPSAAERRRMRRELMNQTGD